MDHLFQTAHRGPAILPLHINGGIVLDQFVLAAGEAGDNGPDVALRAFVAVEIIPQLAAKRNDAEQLLLAEQIALAAGIKVLNSASQFRQTSADAVVGLHRAYRTVEEAVGRPRSAGDYTAA